MTQKDRTNLAELRPTATVQLSPISRRNGLNLGNLQAFGEIWIVCGPAFGMKIPFKQAHRGSGGTCWSETVFLDRRLTPYSPGDSHFADQRAPWHCSAIDPEMCINSIGDNAPAAHGLVFVWSTAGKAYELPAVRGFHQTISPRDLPTNIVPNDLPDAGANSVAL
ncbi:MAG: hypothetical protein AAFQ66_00250 [Pseudomonadota bacterium]